MVAIDTSQVGGVRPVGAAVPSAIPRIAGPSAAHPGDSVSLTAPGLRIALTGAHEASARLSRAAAMADVADEALSRTQDLLERTRGAISQQPGAPVDNFLNAIDATIGGAKFDGTPILAEGVTLNAADESLDLPPATTSDLGAVIGAGRSFRLNDLRTGGALDARFNASAAMRSTDAARNEVASIRSRLCSFRAGALAPAQAGALAQIRSGSVARPVTDAISDAAAIRSGAGTLAMSGGLRAENALSLLG